MKTIATIALHARVAGFRMVTLTMRQSAGVEGAQGSLLTASVGQRVLSYPVSHYTVYGRRHPPLPIE